MARNAYVIARLRELGAMPKSKRPQRHYLRIRRPKAPELPLTPIDEASREALQYVAKVRTGDFREATWFDVARAYYAGRTAVTVSAQRSEP